MSTEMDSKKYTLVYADIPWEDKEWPEERVRGLAVEKWVTADGLMLLWTPVEMVPQSLRLLSIWGFEYGGLIAWRRPEDYLEGYWWRSHCEYVLVGKRGAAKSEALLRHTLYEGAYNKEQHKPEGFRSLLSHSGLFTFGNNITSLDLFGAYWSKKFPGYKKGGWDFLEG